MKTKIIRVGLLEVIINLRSRKFKKRIKKGGK